MAFSILLSQELVLNTPNLYKMAIESNSKKWKTEVSNLKLSSSKKINTQEKISYSNYNNPIPLKDGRIICEKSTFNELNSLQNESLD